MKHVLRPSAVVLAAGLSCFQLSPACLAAPVPEPKGTRAVFKISDDVVVKAPPCFGVNLEVPAMSHWNTEPWHNQWWLAPAINPVSARMKGFVTEGGENSFDDNGGPRIGYWDVYRDGFFDGGMVYVYRLDGASMTLLRSGRIKQYLAAKGGTNRVVFAEEGPVVKKDDLYVITTSRTDFPESVTRTWGQNPWWLSSGFQLQGNQKMLWEQGVRMRIDTNAPPKGAGGCLALTIPEKAGLVRVGYWLIGTGQPDWPRLREGSYTARMWLRQEGMDSGAVDVQIASLKHEILTVDSEWKEYTIDFEAAPPKSTSEAFTIGSSEAGTLYIDNVTLVQNDGPPAYGFYPEVIDTIRRFHPGSLRLWVLQRNAGAGCALDDALGYPEQSNLIFKEQQGAGTINPVGLHQQLVLCQQAGSDPWIITSTFFTEEEQKNLIEYLAGPADSPYGKKRVEMGQAAPWTDVFGKIKIEMGNETWNGMFNPQGFSGKPEVYGAYSENMFRQMKSSEWFIPGKFEFVLNGWVAQPENSKWAWGARALRNAPSADAIDVAYYTGGWDSVGLMKADSEEEGWMNILTFSRRMLLPRAQKFKETADEIAEEQGRPGKIESLVYEAGPGYTLPAPGKFNLEEQQQGKSLAHAINALDIFMMNLRNGFGDQAFFTFKNGHYWASHNRTWGEHIAWKALGMRNTLLQGDLIQSEASEMVTLDVPETQADVVNQSNSADRKVKSFPPLPDLPLIDCYAFKDGNRYSYMLISRRFNGETPVELDLPYDPESSYTKYTLTADSPAAHNIDEEVVKVEESRLEGMTRKFTLSMPPCSVVVLVSNAK